jgi:hypothetical protein
VREGAIEMTLVEKLALLIVREISGDDTEQFYTPEELNLFKRTAAKVLVAIADDLGPDFLSSGDWLRGQAAKVTGESQGPQGGPASDGNS